MSEYKDLGQSDIWARYDNRGLIYESFQIEGIQAEECRSIFLDWSIGLSDDMPHQQAAAELLQLVQDHQPDHPMTDLLYAASQPVSSQRRRKGGRTRGVKGS